MDPIEGIRISWRSITGHPLRSILTTLGVIIGVAAVITFVTLGASLQADIIRTLAGENTDIMYVSASTGGDGGLPDLGRGGQAVFTERDLAELRKLDGVVGVAPESGIAASMVRHKNDSVGRQWVTVVTPNYFGMRGYTFVEGRPFEEGQREVVLNVPATEMFEENVSTGDQVTVVRAVNGERINATVVGIVSEPESGQDSLVVQNRGPAIYTSPQPFYERTVVSPAQNETQRVYARLLVEAQRVEAVEAVQGRVYEYLGERSDARILKSENAQFRVTTYEQLVTQIRQVSNTFTAYITGIALISLVVGAIGIANIMLVSVTERTREIGIMKAIGAQRRDILQLFLIEAVLLGLIGSIVGAVLGLVVGYVGTTVIGLPLQFRTEWLFASVAVGVLVGIVAGGYPAWDAARTDPIEALRYE